MSVLPDVLKPGLRVVFCGTAVRSRQPRPAPTTQDAAIGSGAFSIGPA
jgi:hypothetical protein